MQLSVFARTFAPASLTEILDAVTANGLQSVHFNMACAGLPSMPDGISPSLCEQIRKELESRKLTMVGVSGTYNMIHPDPAQRAQGLERLRVLASACHAMGTDVITLCTGTRDPENQWCFHPDNDSPDAWRDLCVEIEKTLEIAETYDVTLGIEPELANVVNAPIKAQRLIAEMQSERLKIVFDPANIFPAGMLIHQHRILDDAFERLAPHIIHAHAKDLSQDGQAGNLAAGTGRLDYPYYIAQLRSIGFHGPLVMHGLSAQQAPQTVEFLQNLLD